MIWLFDIDGTLVHAGGAGSRSMAAALAAQFSVAVDISSVSFAGRTDLAITRDVFSLHGIEFNSVNVDKFYAAYLEYLPTELNNSRQGGVLPGVCQWLDRLTGYDHCFLGLLTGNMREAAMLKLAHYGLADYFQFGGFGGEHEDRNDVAASAIAAAKEYANGTITVEMWAVGDTPHDIACARSQNAKVIAVATGGHSMEELAKHDPDVLLKDLNDDLPLTRLAEDQIS